MPNFCQKCGAKIKNKGRKLWCENCLIKNNKMEDEKIQEEKEIEEPDIDESGDESLV